MARVRFIQISSGILINIGRKTLRNATNIKTLLNIEKRVLAPIVAGEKLKEHEAFGPAQIGEIKLLADVIMRQSCFRKLKILTEAPENRRRDRKIIQAYSSCLKQNEGRLPSQADLARLVGLTPSTVCRRLKRINDRGHNDPLLKTRGRRKVTNEQLSAAHQKYVGEHDGKLPSQRNLADILKVRDEGAVRRALRRANKKRNADGLLETRRRRIRKITDAQLLAAYRVYIIENNGKRPTQLDLAKALDITVESVWTKLKKLNETRKARGRLLLITRGMNNNR